MKDAKSTQKKSVAFLFTSNEQPERGIKKMISFVIASEKNKMSGINLTKNVQDLYNEN